jgi:hypothetical protein
MSEPMLNDPMPDDVRKLAEEFVRRGWPEDDYAEQEGLLLEVIDLIMLDRSRRPDRDAVIEGWKLVPVEPTEAMIEAAKDAVTTKSTGLGTFALMPRRIDTAIIGYRAMVAAAPRSLASTTKEAAGND